MIVDVPFSYIASVVAPRCRTPVTVAIADLRDCARHAGLHVTPDLLATVRAALASLGRDPHRRGDLEVAYDRWLASPASASLAAPVPDEAAPDGPR